jgi:hypothetical protein
MLLQKGKRFRSQVRSRSNAVSLHLCPSLDFSNEGGASGLRI